MGKKTINVKEILADIKTGMDNTALMEKYRLSEKGQIIESLSDVVTFETIATLSA